MSIGTFPWVPILSSRPCFIDKRSGNLHLGGKGTSKAIIKITWAKFCDKVWFGFYKDLSGIGVSCEEVEAGRQFYKAFSIIKMEMIRNWTGIIRKRKWGGQVR